MSSEEDEGVMSNKEDEGEGRERRASPGCQRGKHQPNLLTRNRRVIEGKMRE